MTRLQSLRNRREILINANNVNGYAQSGNQKTEKYFKVLLAIRKEINEIECKNVRPFKNVKPLSVFEICSLVSKVNNFIRY